MAMPRCNDPIFVLDSGLGGLTVVRALLNRLPGERIIYFGDTARLPYGSKTQTTITHYVRQIVRWGLAHQPKHVVIACNTATALAMPQLQSEFAPLQISGVIEPGARAASGASTKSTPLIGVIATEATIKSRAYEIAIRKRRHRAKLMMTATPLLVPMIEEARSSKDPLVELALKQYLKPMIDNGLDVLVLGCTHYPLIKSAIKTVVGDDVAIIDSADRCAEDVATRLDRAQLSATASAADVGSRLTTYVTDDADRFQRLATRFLGIQIDPPVVVPPEILYQPDDPAQVRVSA